MGCGQSQPAEDQRRVPGPKKGWEEGSKVKIFILIKIKQT
jgi:hypothetical protein